MVEISYRDERNIFTEKDVFKESYQPDEIMERDEEIEQYVEHTEDALFGDQPNNILVYGKTGVGKTVVTKEVMRIMSQESENRDVDVDYLIVNCGHKPTSYQAVIGLVDKLRARRGLDSLNNGYGFADVMKMLYEEIERLESTVYIILDEIDYLGDDDKILYEIPRASANDYVENSKVGLIGISNDYTYRQNLSPKVKDTLQEREIHFPTYEAPELRTILNDRIEKGMDEDAVGQGVVSKCSALAAKDTGSARQAIDLLREAGNVADQDGREEITIDDIESAKYQVERGQLRDGISNLTDHGKYVLLSLASAYEHSEEPQRLKQILSAYETVCEKNATDPLSEYRVRDHLSDLKMLGFVEKDKENKGMSGGRYYVYDITVDPEMIFEVVENE